MTDYLAPELLDAERQRSWAEALANDSHRMVAIDGALRGEIADAAAKYLLSESAEWDTEYGLFEASDVTEKRFENATDSDRFYRYDILVHPEPDDDEPAAAEFGTFLDFIESPELRAVFEAIHGAGLGPAEEPTVHAMRASDYLKPHNDRSDGRRLAAVLYLNPAWQPDHGGAFRMFGANGARRVEAVYNRLLVFDVEAHYGHNVEPVQPTAPGPRLSVGWWLPDP